MLTSVKNRLLSSSRAAKQSLVSFSDFISLTIAVFLASKYSNILNVNFGFETLTNLIFIPLSSVFIFYFLGVYKTVLRYIDFGVIYLLLKALFLAFIINLVIKYIYVYYLYVFFQISFQSLISLAGWLVGLLAALVLLVGSRIFANFFFSYKVSEKNVVIYGAGSAGIQLAEALKVSSEMQPIAFLDNNPSLENTFLGGIKIMNPNKLRKLVLRKKVDEVLLAMPSASKSVLRSLLKEIEEYSIKVRILPGLAELAQGKVLVSELKEVDITDLLGRYEVEANQELINKDIRDKVVLITGAGGSIGSEISRQVSENRPKSLILLDSNEYSLYAIKKEIEDSYPKIDLNSILVSVNNKNRLIQVFKAFSVDTIYHSAAYKHVSLVEENPFEAVLNNILGTKNSVEAAIESNVSTFVLISTDKAVRPTNIMGATKRFSELILQALSSKTEIKNIRMTMVRFGNVIGSSGSAIPLFQQQIREGGPVTVTHPDVVRYFMSIPEAAELVIQAGAMGEGGDVFVLDMGEPVKIVELAKRLINLNGMEFKDVANPNGDIEIIFTGLRPGEKLYEELLIGNNVSKTEHKQILRAQEHHLSIEEVDEFISLILDAEKNNDVMSLKKLLEEAIPGYTPEDGIVDIVHLRNNL